MKENEIVYTKDNIDGVSFVCPPDKKVFTINKINQETVKVIWDESGLKRWTDYSVRDVVFRLNMSDWKPIKTQTPKP